MFLIGRVCHCEEPRRWSVVLQQTCLLLFAGRGAALAATASFIRLWQVVSALLGALIVGETSCPSFLSGVCVPLLEDNAEEGFECGCQVSTLHLECMTVLTVEEELKMPVYRGRSGQVGGSRPHVACPGHRPPGLGKVLHERQRSAAQQRRVARVSRPDSRGEAEGHGRLTQAPAPPCRSLMARRRWRGSGRLSEPQARRNRPVRVKALWWAVDVLGTVVTTLWSRRVAGTVVSGLFLAWRGRVYFGMESGFDRATSH